MLDPEAKISVQRTGGFAGVQQNFLVTASDLNNEEQKQLDALVERCGLKTSGDADLKSKGARDMFVYTFTLVENEAKYYASFDDKTLSTEYRELLQFIQSASHAR